MGGPPLDAQGRLVGAVSVDDDGPGVPERLHRLGQVGPVMRRRRTTPVRCGAKPGRRAHRLPPLDVPAEPLESLLGWYRRYGNVFTVRFPESGPTYATHAGVSDVAMAYSVKLHTQQAAGSSWAGKCLGWILMGMPRWSRQRASSCKR